MLWRLHSFKIQSQDQVLFPWYPSFWDALVTVLEMLSTSCCIVLFQCNVPIKVLCSFHIFCKYGRSSVQFVILRSTIKTIQISKRYKKDTFGWIFLYSTVYICLWNSLMMVFRVKTVALLPLLHVTPARLLLGPLYFCHSANDFNRFIFRILPWIRKSPV